MDCQRQASLENSLALIRLFLFVCPFRLEFLCATSQYVLSDFVFGGF